MRARVRPIALVVLVLGMFVLLMDYAATQVSGAMPFATSYHPRHYELVTLGGLGGLLFAFALGLLADNRLIAWLLGIALGLIAASTIAFLAYHADHPWHLLVPDGFRGHPETVTAFHVQLATPLFVTLGGAAAILAATVRR